jgi:hypothetical protein
MIQIRVKYISIFIIVIIVCLVIVSCSSVPIVKDSHHLSKLQIHGLAERILENTPEYIHFAPGAKFSWVLFSPVTTSNAPELQNEVISLLKKKYTVYFNRSDIPNEFLYKGNDGKLRGYKSGFSFAFTTEFEKTGIVKINYWDWEGNMAASSHWTRYKRTGKQWDVIGKSRLIVS